MNWTNAPYQEKEKLKLVVQPSFKAVDQTHVKQQVIEKTETIIYLVWKLPVPLGWSLVILLSLILKFFSFPSCREFLAYTLLKRDFTANFNMLFLVMEVISLVDEINFFI